MSEIENTEAANATTSEAVNENSSEEALLKQITSSNSNKSEETASEEEAEVVEEPETTETEDKWFVPGKFKAPEDVLKSYEHIQTAFGRSQNELSKAMQRLAELEAKKDVEDSDKIFKELVEKDPVKAIEYKAELTAKKIASQQENKLRAIEMQAAYKERLQDPEFAKLEPVMGNLAKEFQDELMQRDLYNKPVSALFNDPYILDLLHIASRGFDQANQLKTKTASAKKQGEMNALKKTKAQIEGGSGSRSTNTKTIEEMNEDELLSFIKKSGTR